eukprot:150473_1
MFSCSQEQSSGSGAFPGVFGTLMSTLITQGSCPGCRMSQDSYTIWLRVRQHHIKRGQLEIQQRAAERVAHSRASARAVPERTARSGHSAGWNMDTVNDT